MGSYNPHLPRILGQEWVPIRDELTEFSPTVNAIEVGHEFTLDTSRVLSTGRVYVNTPAPAYSRQVLWASVYPAASIGASGPIRQVIIPCNSGGVTGTGVTASPSVAAALLSPGDSTNVLFTTPDGNLKQVGMYFATNQYAALLNDKRILDVSLLYAGAGYTLVGSEFVDIDPDERGDIDLSILTNSGTITLETYGPLNSGFTYDNGGLNNLSTTQVHRISLGEVCVDPNIGSYPMTYADLQRFEASPSPISSRFNLRVIVTTDSTWNSNNVIALTYGALLVTYCEETRSAVGVVESNLGLSIGMNSGTMRTVGARSANPVLTAGDYIVTASAPALGELQSDEWNPQVNYVGLNAVRELYEIPPHEGVQINIPSPVVEHVDDAFEIVETSILPQISLHTSGGPLTEVHVYGRQAIAQVYGSITATQEIYDTPVGSAQEFPWVRFYARRWGDTTISLTLDSPSIVGSSVSITPAEFDALDEISNGWKEVTLRFDTPPSMGTGTIPQWRWSATGETAGNRWEILGATAPAISAVPGNLMNLVPSPNQLSIATYGAPVSGAGVNLGWIPQYAPPVSATVDDQTSDATIIFAMDMPTVTGFSVVGASQAVEGIGQNCGVDPCCIPTDINYNLLTWSPTSSSIPVSGFGYYEMQRMDEVDNDWATIMKSTSPTGATFNDFEARVGVESSYRIRAVDLYEFPGLWSDTITITPAAPGVSGGCLEGGHLLIFTSNERQDGSVNLAYSTVWEGRVEESFTLPEAGFVQLQAMYDRDFFTAFRPSERGGDRFTRQVLVQAAAIAPETLADFTSLRDMAWADTSYICVRDEDGNRWLATVMVPDARVMFYRRIYMAPVEIVEVTATPSPVDPYA